MATMRIARRCFMWAVATCMIASIIACRDQHKLALPTSDISADANQFSLGNRWLIAHGTAHGGHWAGLRVVDRATGRSIHDPEAFSLQLKDGTVLRSSTMEVTKPFHLQELRPDPTASRYVAQLPGHEVCAEFSDSQSHLWVNWCGILRQDSNYFRQSIVLRVGQHALPITRVGLLDFADAGARVDGAVKGSPIVDGTMFFGFEDPLSTSEVRNGNAVAFLPRKLPLRPGETVTYSSVIGVAPAGQMRRAFLRYIERERAHPYRPFLQYNSWFDLAANNSEAAAVNRLGFKNYGEAIALNRIRAIGNELTVKRGAEVRSFVFDDGWDNRNSVWGFDSRFPNGFTKVSQAAARYHSHIGLWLSPLGGYGKPKQERLAAGRKRGYEIINGGFALSAPKYYAQFQHVCLNMVHEYGANEFKFDGTESAGRVYPGSRFDSDYDAMIHLTHRLRKAEPNIFINLTSGAASPFWLLYSDAIWRGGHHDYFFAGVGSSRQRWITYRDAKVYQYIVQKGPLFPLNSLMVHGIIYARMAPGLNTDPNHDFRDEVESFFGSGTQVQELYITPSLLSSGDWDILAKGAKWSLRNAETLKDTHWIGGDPAKLQVYGWAAWSPEKAIITLRNPSNKPQTYSLNIKKALELPAGAPNSYVAHNPWSDGAHVQTIRVEAGHPLDVKLEPFEVRTFDAVPSQR